MSHDVRHPAGVPLKVAATVLALEALVTVGFAIVQLLFLEPLGATSAIVTAVVVLGYAAALGFVAYGVARGRRWSRAPAIATQLVQLPVAWGLRSDPTTPIALAMGTASALVVVCLLLPSSTAIFVPETERRPPA